MKKTIRISEVDVWILKEALHALCADIDHDDAVRWNAIQSIAERLGDNTLVA